MFNNYMVYKVIYKKFCKIIQRKENDKKTRKKTIKTKFLFFS